MAVAFHTHTFDIPTATDADVAAGVRSDVAVVPSNLGTASQSDIGDFATAAQGTLADSAVQPGDLGDSAGLDVGTTAGTVAAGDDTRIVNALQASSVGSTVQAFDADLTAIAALTSDADKMPYAAGAGTWAMANFTAAGRAIVDDANASAQRVTLGLASSDSDHLLHWGNLLGAGWDGVSDSQAIFSQTQPTFLPNGSLGALYAQRINTYAGGATADNVTPTCAAVRGYNQIADTVTYCNENGGLFTTDNHSWLGQGVGMFGQANSIHGGRTFGSESEAIEHPETYTPANGTTVLVVPNNFVAGSQVVVKNGTVITSGVDYTVTAKPASDQTGTISSISGTGTVVTVAFSGGFTPPVNYYVDIAGVTPNVYNGRWKVLTSSAGNATLSAPGSGAMTVAGTLQVKTALAGSVTLTTPANGTDVFKVIRGDPEFAASGAEVIVYAAGGTDNGNTLSGNRVGLSIFGWRSTTEAITTKVGTLLNLISSPSDASLTVDRGINFQGKFVNGIDFTAANATFSSFMMKFNGSGAGLSATGSLLRLGDSTHIGRMQVTTASGAIFGSDTAIDVILTRAGLERVRLRSDQINMQNTNGVVFVTEGTHTARVQAHSASGIIFGGDTNIDVLFTRQSTERFRLTALNTAVGIQLATSGTTYANDAAAAAGGVPVNGIYRNGSVLQVRVS